MRNLVWLSRFESATCQMARAARAHSSTVRASLRVAFELVRVATRNMVRRCEKVWEGVRRCGKVWEGVRRCEKVREGGKIWGIWGDLGRLHAPCPLMAWAGKAWRRGS